MRSPADGDDASDMNSVFTRKESIVTRRGCAIVFLVVTSILLIGIVGTSSSAGKGFACIFAGLLSYIAARIAVPSGSFQNFVPRQSPPEGNGD